MTSTVKGGAACGEALERASPPAAPTPPALTLLLFLLLVLGEDLGRVLVEGVATAGAADVIGLALKRDRDGAQAAGDHALRLLFLGADLLALARERHLQLGVILRDGRRLFLVVVDEADAA